MSANFGLRNMAFRPISDPKIWHAHPRIQTWQVLPLKDLL